MFKIGCSEPEFNNAVTVLKGSIKKKFLYFQLRSNLGPVGTDLVKKQL